MPRVKAIESILKGCSSDYVITYRNACGKDWESEGFLYFASESYVYLNKMR